MADTATAPTCSVDTFSANFTVGHKSFKAVRPILKATFSKETVRALADERSSNNRTYHQRGYCSVYPKVQHEVTKRDEPKQETFQELCKSVTKRDVPKQEIFQEIFQRTASFYQQLVPINCFKSDVREGVIQR